MFGSNSKIGERKMESKHQTFRKVTDGKQLYEEVQNEHTEKVEKLGEF